jgi:hypothetical protein
LDSTQLRGVLTNYSKARRPNLAVAATAVFRAEKILTAKMGTALNALELSPDRYEILALLTYTRGGRMSLKDLGNAVLRHDLVRRAAKVLERIDWGMDELSDEEAAVVARVLSRLHPA